jgi:hypothetical protein
MSATPTSSAAWRAAAEKRAVPERTGPQDVIASYRKLDGAAPLLDRRQHQKTLFLTVLPCLANDADQDGLSAAVAGALPAPPHRGRERTPGQKFSATLHMMLAPRLKRQNLRRADGPEGRLRKNGPFGKRRVAACD